MGKNAWGVVLLRVEAPNGLQYLNHRFQAPSLYIGSVRVAVSTIDKGKLSTSIICGIKSMEDWQVTTICIAAG